MDRGAWPARAPRGARPRPPWCGRLGTLRPGRHRVRGGDDRRPPPPHGAAAPGHLPDRRSPEADRVGDLGGAASRLRGAPCRLDEGGRPPASRIPRPPGGRGPGGGGGAPRVAALVPRPGPPPPMAVRSGPPPQAVSPQPPPGTTRPELPP